VELISTEYPILIFHCQVKIERISEEEAEKIAWEKLFD